MKFLNYLILLIQLVLLSLEFRQQISVLLLQNLELSIATASRRCCRLPILLCSPILSSTWVCVCADVLIRSLVRGPSSDVSGVGPIFVAAESELPSEVVDILLELGHFSLLVFESLLDLVELILDLSLLLLFSGLLLPLFFLRPHQLSKICVVLSQLRSHELLRLQLLFEHSNLILRLLLVDGMIWSLLHQVLHEEAHSKKLILVGLELHFLLHLLSCLDVLLQYLELFISSLNVRLSLFQLLLQRHHKEGLCLELG